MRWMHLCIVQCICVECRQCRFQIPGESQLAARVSWLGLAGENSSAPRPTGPCAAACSQLQHSSTPAAQQGSLLQRSNCVSCTLWSKSDHFSSSFWVEGIMEDLAEHYSQSGRVVEFPLLKRMIGHFFYCNKDRWIGPSLIVYKSMKMFGGNIQFPITTNYL